MKKSLFLFFTICSFIQLANAQLQSCELILSNGSKSIVQGKIGGSKFKYKLSGQNKIHKIHFSEIGSVKVNYSEDDFKIYKYFKVESSGKFKVLEEIEKGKVSLYITSSSGYMNPFASGMGRMPYTIENYYLKKQSDDEVIHLASNRLFSKNFIEGSTAFFKDCEDLTNKIKNKELKKRDIIEIVKFYNNHCN
ncbi:hypothetical protein [Flavivirga sp. 57AJ16]|uniref:hypothetical protein n=1 Tax=Flavivirga sp. 57AJ16 TaxID=3025307 RepID=UPI00236609C5|nr:hypothetical protein [Flavivirga sp. 57AJ16]MDD7886033.1 hypothetical protein [Flavivirga sp. 57AJ16]